MTRRETLVKFLRSANGYTEDELRAALAIPSVPGFLTRAQSEGIANEELADRLVAFKQNGGSGLANAVAQITNELDGAATASDECDEALEGIRDDLEALVLRVNAALGS